MAEDFWQDRVAAEAIFQRLNVKKDLVTTWLDLSRRVEELCDLAELIRETTDDTELHELDREVEKLGDDFRQAETKLLMRGKYDEKDCYLSIHAGTGGVDAQDWAEMLLRMYLRYAEANEFKANIISISPAEEAGIKSATLIIKGANAYGFLQSESGVHRLVRQSPFNAKNLRQTSFALVEVLPVFDDDLDIELNKDDLKIDTYRASGHGGQSVNKTDSAVRITHLPTGLVVSCQNERSQHQNKEVALRMLKAKLFALREEEKKEQETILKGDVTQGSWGNQIRSYVFHPYKMVKDHRTNYETSQVDKVMDGDLDDFIEEYLRQKKVV